MVIAFHPSVAGYRAPWPDSLRVAREAGFGAVDLDLEQMVDAHDPDDVRGALEAAGLRAGACPLPVEMRQDEATFEAGLARFARVASFAAAVGVHAMHRSVPAASSRPAAEFVPVLRCRWRACAAIAREHGVTLAVEPLGPLYRRRAGPHEILWRLADVAAFADSCGPGVGLLIDSWHWHLGGSTAEEIAALRGVVAHVHVADVPPLPDDAQRDTERALPGEGVVDFEGFLRGVAGAGYDGIASLEIPGSWSTGLEPLVASQRALAAANGVMA
ncbi:MAG TPA: sugar phosphate isomerase/epimerase family protein, partial [Solirubrobacteraceae bacterium]|nr:sugar phosphate isomerase/epimerase family protein [Solirubrobacteraceae bacterium]